MAESSMKGLDEIFKCFICLEKLKDAHLCPHCSKPCCSTCIRQWLLSAKKSRCPHCRKPLLVENLVNCRWFDDVTQALDSLQQIKENADKDLCITHNEKLSVFCMNCDQCICHQCALWGENHLNHVFKPLEEVWFEHAVKVDIELIRLRQRHTDIMNNINEIDKSSVDLNKAKAKTVDQIKNFMKQMISGIEKDLKMKMLTNSNQKSLWSKECAEIEAIIESSERELKACSKSELLLTSKNIMQSISELKNQPLTDLANLGVTIDEAFPNEIIPSYDSSTFVISNFSSFHLNGQPVFSPPLKASGLTWRLKVYPSGNEHEWVQYLSVHFELSSEFSERSRHQYKVEMMQQMSGDSSKTVVQEFTSDFDAGECWGFNRFYPLDRLVGEGYLSAEDTLVLKFSVRPASYYQKSKIQEWYINQLQSVTLKC